MNQFHIHRFRVAGPDRNPNCCGADREVRHTQNLLGFPDHFPLLLGVAFFREFPVMGKDISGEAGVFAIMVHALSESARQFYLSRGFVESPLQPMTLMMTLDTVRAILSEPD